MIVFCVALFETKAVLKAAKFKNMIHKCVAYGCSSVAYIKTNEDPNSHETWLVFNSH